MLIVLLCYVNMSLFLGYRSLKGRSSDGKEVGNGNNVGLKDGRCWLAIVDSIQATAWLFSK